MGTAFNIEISFQTAAGPETFGYFTIGNNPETADAIFSSLKGTAISGKGDLLTIDFIETRNGLPVNLKMITCTLDQLGDNCRIITKEIFKSLNPGTGNNAGLF